MRVSVGDCRLYVDVDGLGLVPDGPVMRERPTVVLLHGGPGADHTRLKPTFEVLTDVAQVVYYDHRGQGRSDRTTPDRWNHDQWADDLVALCDALGIVDPVVCGVSFGGILALHYAVRHPGHASRLIVDSGAAVTDVPGRLAVFERLGGHEAVAAAQALFDHADADTMVRYATTCMPLYARHPHPDLADMRARGMPHANLAAFQHWQAGEERTYDLRGSLDRITCPVLVLAGEDDPMCPAAGSRAIAAEIGPERCTLDVVSDCGHAVCEDRPDVGLAAIRAFLAS
jgi:pimeloyl-ACP methyl ester carboxylesterase